MKRAHFLSLLALATMAAAEETPWINLFDGKTLDGWKQLNGTATYKVEDETIVGTTEPGSPNSFLCSEREFGDFELEFDVKVDNALNSGVQIRSQVKDGKPGGRVNGPQVEIEASPGQAGFIYGEATSWGWISPKPKNQEKASEISVFKNDGWNHYRVVAVGPRIQVWVNGEQVEDLTNDEAYKIYPKGFLGLQVHSFHADDKPHRVAWKNIRVKPLN